MKAINKLLVLVFLPWWVNPVWPASPEPTPDAELRRQQEREAQQRRQFEANRPDVRLGGDALKPQGFDGVPLEQPCFVLRQLHVRSTAGEVIDAFAWLEPRLMGEGASSLAGRCVGAQGVAWLIDLGQKLLVEHGFVTSRLLAGTQDMSQGRLTLTLVPGRIHQIRFEPSPPEPSRLHQALPMQTGDVLNLRDIEQALENFKRVPTVEADIQIMPAQGERAQIGESDLVIAHRQTRPIRLNLSLDDGGTKATGKLLSAATVSVDNWMSVNDLFYLTLNTDLGAGDPGPRGTRGKTAHYSLPFGYWTWGLTWSESRYAQQVAGLNGPYVYSGTSQNTEVKASRLVFRDTVQKLHVSLAAFQRKSNNYVEDTEVMTQRRVEGGWIAGLAHKTFIGEATLESNAQYKTGTKDFGAIAAPEDNSGWGTSQFALATADVNFTAPFKLAAQHLRFNSTLRAQTYYTPLTPLNRFSIAGRYTVRGFDGENTLIGERGWLTRNELSMALSDSGQEIYYGLDHGEVGGRSSDLLVGKTLTGNAVGLRGAWRKFSYDIFLAAPVRKPDHFKAPPYVAGFSMSLSY